MPAPYSISHSLEPRQKVDPDLSYLVCDEAKDSSSGSVQANRPARR